MAALLAYYRCECHSAPPELNIRLHIVETRVWGAWHGHVDRCERSLLQIQYVLCRVSSVSSPTCRGISSTSLQRLRVRRWACSACEAAWPHRCSRPSSPRCPHPPPSPSPLPLSPRMPPRSSLLHRVPHRACARARRACTRAFLRACADCVSCVLSRGSSQILQWRFSSPRVDSSPWISRCDASIL